MQQIARDRFLDHWRVAKGPSLRRLLEEVQESLVEHERLCGARKRDRKPDDQERWVAMVEAVVCDLAHFVLCPGETGGLVYRLRAHDPTPIRYRNPAFGKCRRRLLQLLLKSGFVTSNRARQVGHATTIRPTAAFAALVRQHGVSFADFGRKPSEEVLILTRSTRSRGGRVKEQIDYPESIETSRLRADVRRLNAFYENADIAFIPDGGPAVDAHNRRLTRRFTVLEEQEPRWDQSGRFFGAFWEGLASTRRGNLRINGEPVVVLDYASMFTRLAYAEMGVTPPPGDLYAIPRLERLPRSLIKRAVNLFYFGEGAGRRQWPEDLKGHFPADMTPTRVRKAILQHHPALEQSFGSWAGFRLMFMESEVLLAVLTRCMDAQIVVLGLHDGLMAPRSSATQVKMIMEEVVMETTHAPIPAEVKTTGPPEKDPLPASSIGEPVSQTFRSRPSRRFFHAPTPETHDRNTLTRPRRRSHASPTARAADADL